MNELETVRTPPLRHRIYGLEDEIKADQIRTLDKTRLVKGTGKFEHTLMEEIEGAIRIHLGIDAPFSI